jgi:hypothetical protein
LAIRKAYAQVCRQGAAWSTWRYSFAESPTPVLRS